MAIGDRIRECRISKRKTLEQVADAVGVSRQTMSRYETGVIGNIPSDKIEAIAKYLNTTPSSLMGWDGDPKNEIHPYIPTYRIPILGRISAGLPLYADENIEGYMMTELNGGAEYFALRVRGDSMTAARIYDGDILVVRRQDHVENGQIAVVLVNGDEATVKKFYRTDTTVSLVPQSLNPEHQMQIYDVSKTEIKVLGLVVQIVINV